MPSDLLIRGATVVLPGVFPIQADVAVTDGLIEAIGPELPGAAEEIDARGLHLLPGVIDAHVHFNEPGRTEWEGWATGSRALAAGGATTCIEMPLNAHPPTDRRRRLRRQGRGGDRGVGGRLRALGRARAGQPGPARRAGRARRRRLQGLHVRQRDRGLPGRRRRAARGRHGARRRPRPARPRPRRAPVRAARPAGHELARLRRLAPHPGRARGDRGRDRARRAHRLRPARGARQQRRGRRPRGGEQRHVRDLPALPDPHRGRPRDARHAREVRAAAAAGPRGRGALARAERRRVRRLRPLAVPARDEGGRLHRRLGRDRRARRRRSACCSNGCRPRRSPR